MCEVGFLRADITNGIVIKHPACSVPYCKIDLELPKKKFYPQYQDQDHVCAICDCTNIKKNGRETCQVPSHKEAEDNYKKDKKAMERLRKMLPIPVEDIVTAKSNINVDEADKAKKSPESIQEEKKTHSRVLETK